jgi:MSHA biogenesis protein MshQ
MSGDGWLRLTQNNLWQSSFVYYNTPIPTNLGLTFEFDFVVWTPNASVADGFTLAIFDAAVTPDAGGYGGSLGYAQRSGIDGLAGGIAGFGFDEFGNFSRRSEGRVGGTDVAIPNAIAIRGSMGATRQEGYAYQTGTGSLSKFSTTGATTRAAATIHRVRITIPTSRQVTIEWTDETGKWKTLINKWQCTLACPENIKFGFTAGTGAVSGYHEIRNLEVRDAAVPEPGSFALALGLGIVAVVGWRRRRAR